MYQFPGRKKQRILQGLFDQEQKRNHRLGLNNMQDQRIVMCGMHETGWEVLRSLLENKRKISYIVTIDKDTALKANASGYKPFQDLAQKFDVPIHFLKTYNMKDPDDIAFFERENFDLLIQGGWQRLFPEEILSTLNIGAIGMHGSSEFLPKGRGRSPINWTLIEGKRRFILQFFLIKPGVDDGDVFHYEIFDVNEWDDCRTLYYKNSIITKSVYFEWIPKLLKGEFSLAPQIGKATYYPKRTVEDGRIDWTKSVYDIHNFVRALTKPYPGAFTFLDGQRVNIWKAQPFDTRIAYPIAVEGEIVEVFSTGDFLVNCNSGLLLVTQYDHTGQVGQVFE